MLLERVGNLQAPGAAKWQNAPAWQVPRLMEWGGRHSVCRYAPFPWVGRLEVGCIPIIDVPSVLADHDHGTEPDRV
jgi:hypothetical protein